MASANADESLLRQHAVDGKAHSRLRGLHCWRETAAQLRSERAAALRQQHVWARVSTWLAADTNTVGFLCDERYFIYCH